MKVFGRVPGGEGDDRLPARLVGQWVGRLVGRLVGWLAGRLVSWLVG